jgi:hypothetical protein
MYHTIEFSLELEVDLEVSRTKPLERLLIRRGTHLRAQIRPYVIEGSDGPIEVADLFFENGSTTRRVPFAWFNFVR